MPFNDHEAGWPRTVVTWSPDKENIVGKRPGRAGSGIAAEVAGRRAVLAGLGVVGAGTLAACSSGSSASSTPSATATSSGAPSAAGVSSSAGTPSSAVASSPAAPVSSSTPAAPATAPSSASASTAAAAPAGFSVAESEIPVGTGKYFSAAAVIITQPTAGSFRAFTSVCTHQGCPVTQSQGALMVCPCHGSQYSIKDGSVVMGPATAPLAAKKFTVAGGKVVVAKT